MLLLVVVVATCVDVITAPIIIVTSTPVIIRAAVKSSQQQLELVDAVAIQQVDVHARDVTHAHLSVHSNTTQNSSSK